MYIDNSYFKGQLEIPNSQDYPGSIKDGNVVRVKQYIDQFEVELMVYALGHPLYDEFHSIFNVDGTLKPGTDQKWIDFVDGKPYQKDGENYLWKGLRYTDGTIKKSLIANYVYCKFLNDYSVNFGGVGMQTEEANNASRQSSIPRIVSVWNDFVGKYQGDYNIEGGDIVPVVRSSAYGLSIGVDYYNDRSDYFVSMYQYLIDHDADFPTAKTYFFSRMNSLGL